ncbi:MAG: hypothetical protein Q8O89_01720 [Nanoarchaeota archaeon]|nr:hypothetical protein [Nanoarchaeota archaeon]
MKTKEQTLTLTQIVCQTLTKEIIPESDFEKHIKNCFYSFSLGVMLGAGEKKLVGSPYISAALTAADGTQGVITPLHLFYWAGVATNYICEIYEILNKRLYLQ